MLHNGNVLDLQAAIIGLATRGYTGEFHTMRQILFTEDERISGYIRMDIVDAFGDTGERRAVPDLERLAMRMDYSQNYLFLSRVILALGRIAIPKAKAIVEKFTDHNNQTVRNNARAIASTWNQTFTSNTSPEEDNVRRTVLSNLYEKAKRKNQLAMELKKRLEQKRRLDWERDLSDTNKWREYIRRKKEAVMQKRKSYYDALASGNVLTHSVWWKIRGPWSDEYFALIKTGRVLTTELFYLMGGGKEHCD